MEKKDIVLMILSLVILLILASLTIPVLVRTIPAGLAQQNPLQQQLQPQQAGPTQPVQQGQSPGVEESKHLKTVVSFINIGLIIPLFIIYVGIYRRMKSSFTLGLLAVILALGMYAVTSCPLIISLAGGRTGDIGFFQILPDLCTTVALVVLVRISLE